VAVTLSVVRSFSDSYVCRWPRGRFSVDDSCARICHGGPLLNPFHRLAQRAIRPAFRCVWVRLTLAWPRRSFTGAVLWHLPFQRNPRIVEVQIDHRELGA
jgi:hypothetical protein